MTDCLFCKMVAGVIKPDTVYEDQDILAFKDIHPRAPLHVLVVPKIHIPSLKDLKTDHSELVGKLFLAPHAIAKKHGYAEMGYRTVLNCNADAGQSIFHIHLHVLGGRAMGWPPFPS
jgi:histidine triad (HIT) family protein